MSAPRVMDLVDLVRKEAKYEPTFVVARELASFEVAFGALELEEDEGIAPWDEAVLALARARGAVSARDADAYLGLGASLAHSIVTGLSSEEDASPLLGSAAAEGYLEDHGAPPVRSPALTRTVQSSEADDSLFVLTEDGEDALDTGQRTRRYERPASMLFTEEPLRFLRVTGEDTERYKRRIAELPLDPKDVPPPFRTIDDLIALSPESRVRAIGLGATVPGLRGRVVRVARSFEPEDDTPPRLLGAPPGSSWEVRRGPAATGAVAGFATSEPAALLMRSFLGNGRWLRMDLLLDPEELLNGVSYSPAEIAATLRAAGHTVLGFGLHGAFEIRCTADDIVARMAPGPSPGDTFVEVPGKVEGDILAARVRASPADRAAANVVFLELLGRRADAVARDLESACADLAGELSDFWQQTFETPPIEEVATRLWARPNLRPALCQRRLRRDLVDAYSIQETTPQ